MIKTAVLILIFLTNIISASDHGIFMKTLIKYQGNIDSLFNELSNNISSAGFDILSKHDISVPDLVREDSTEHCGAEAKLLVFSSKQYTDFLTSYNNKYLIAGFLRAAVYTTSDGLNISIADPETINRIVFNDLWENDQVDQYLEVIAKTNVFKSKIIDAVHAISSGEKVKIISEPIRSDEDLMESSKDMFMMVGPMTFFNDEDQFPEIFSTAKSNNLPNLLALKELINKNMTLQEPSIDDIEYRYTKDSSILKWQQLCETKSSDGKAILIGLTRPRTEAVSFHIAGSAREDESNLCPGIDHAAAYPIEILLIEQKNQLKVYTTRQMFRMDMYFWDAGMMAFMDHMSMPDILDQSIRKAILGDFYED